MGGQLSRAEYDEALARWLAALLVQQWRRASAGKPDNQDTHPIDRRDYPVRDKSA